MPAFSFVVVAVIAFTAPVSNSTLVGAGLVSVVAFPAIAFALLGDERRKGQLTLGEESGFSAESTRL